MRGVYYGWVLMVVLGITETVSWGIIYYAFTVYLAPMEADLHWSRGDMTGAFSLGLLLAGLSAIPVGRWLDRRGPRLVMTLGSIAGSLLIFAWSRVTSLTSFYLIWIALGPVMACTLYDPAFATATKWFERDRVRALTLITLMAGFASTIFIPLAGWLVEVQGWRDSLVTLAMVLAVVTILPHALLLRDAPDGMRPRTDNEPRRRGMRVGEALRHASFRWVAAAFWLATLATIAVGVHLLPYLQDRGYDATFAATVTGLVGAMQVLARLLVAPIGSRVSPRLMTAAILALQPVSLLVLLLVRSTAGVLAFVVLFGAQRGLATLARPALVADLYGPAQFASIAGVLQFTLSLAQAAAPVGAGAAYDLAHSYEPIFWALALVSALAVVAILPAQRQKAETLQ